MMANPEGNPQNLESYQSQWKCGKTKTIRVPIEIASLVMESAREFDAMHYRAKLKEEAADKVAEALEILKSALIPRKQGGIYESNHANPLRKEVLKAIALIEEGTKK